MKENEFKILTAIVQGWVINVRNPLPETVQNLINKKIYYFNLRMKNFLFILLALSLSACASTKYNLVAPQGTDEAKHVSNIEYCTLYGQSVASRPAFAGPKIDECLERRGYNYVEVK